VPSNDYKSCYIFAKGITMNNMLGVIGAGGLIGALFAIVILGMISYNEKRALEQYRVDMQVAHERRMEKYDRILELLDQMDNNLDKIEEKTNGIN
jgi:hypothetical protein